MSVLRLFDAACNIVSFLKGNAMILKIVSIITFWYGFYIWLLFMTYFAYIFSFSIGVILNQSTYNLIMKIASISWERIWCEEFLSLLLFFVYDILLLKLCGDQ